MPMAITKTLVLEGRDSAEEQLDSGKEGVRAFMAKRKPTFANYDTPKVPEMVEACL